MTLDTPSKIIKKTDEAGKELIIELLGDQVTGGFDIDSVYKINGKWIILELLKCDTVRPHDSHPNRYWFKNKRKFISLWEIAQDLKGSLFLLNYEDNREQFLLIKVLDINKENGISKEEKIRLTLEEVKSWFKKLNNHDID
jgi:hypothetical protein